MTGVYRLYWDDCKQFYIGCSNHIERRYVGHIAQLKGGNHHNKLVQGLYNKYGSPKYEVIEICNPGRLLKAERYHISKADNILICNKIKRTDRGLSVPNVYITIDVVKTDWLAFSELAFEQGLVPKNLLKTMITEYLNTKKTQDNDTKK